MPPNLRIKIRENLMQATICIFLALTVGVAPALAFGQPATAPPAPASPVNGCTIFDPVDVAKLPKAAPTDGPVITSELIKRHADWRPDAGADAEIALDSIDPLGGTRTTTLAARAGGVWRVSGVSGSIRSSEKTPPAQTKQVALDADQAAALNAVLADACFWSTPPILPNNVPLKSGKVATCFDGMNTDFRVRLGERRWYGEQDCRVVGLPGRLAAILWKASVPAHFSGMFNSVR